MCALDAVEAGSRRVLKTGRPGVSGSRSRTLAVHRTMSRPANLDEELEMPAHRFTQMGVTMGLPDLIAAPLAGRAVILRPRAGATA